MRVADRLRKNIAGVIVQTIEAQVRNGNGSLRMSEALSRFPVKNACP